MEIKGAVLAFVDVAPELTGDYNRWYDLDHLPTHISRPEVIAGRRYVADKALKALRRNVGMESLQDGKGAYFTTYLTNTTDFDSYRVSGRELDRGLNRAGRMWRQGYVPYAGNYRVTGTYAAEGILVAPEAVPHLGHRGVVVIIGDAKDIGAAKAWWEGTGLPAALAVDGVHGAVAFAGYAEEEAGRLAYMLLVEADPADAALNAALDAALDPPADAWTPLVTAPLRAVRPFEYDFDF